MTIGGRNRRPDDWPSSHVRARAAISEQLDGPIPPEEAAWLAEHLEACPDCRLIAGAYEAQQRELWALRDVMPQPPRDLWARTAAAIESESRFRKQQKPALGWSPKFLIPSALIASALVVAVAAGTLTSSWRFNSGGDGATKSQTLVAAASEPASLGPTRSGPGPTKIPVTANISVVTKDPSGAFSIRETDVNSVCPSDAEPPCDSSSGSEDHPVVLDQEASTVFGSTDKQRLIVVSDPTSASSGSVSVVTLTDEPGPSATPAPPTPSAPPPSPTPSSTGSSSSEPSPSVTVSAPPGGPIEIAHDVILVGQSAAYSRNGSWFAFTARPVDGAVGPDIYVWKVGEPLAMPLTTDHRSIFGSWVDDVMVGSTVVEATIGNGSSAKTELRPSSYLLDPATRLVTALPQTGEAWRPAVDPTGRRAIYWSGVVRSTTSPGFAPDTGKLVLGDWGTGSSAPSEGPLPTPLKHDQANARHETTISAGRIEDWDARWDPEGTHVAIWIADPQDPKIGRLSLYAVDSFDGRIDLKTPLIDGERASAGFAISDRQLVWVEPATDGSTTSQVQLLVWTATGVGKVSSLTDSPIVIR